MTAIYRGTTPTIKIKVPIQQEFIATLNISIKQFEIIVIERNSAEIQVDSENNIWAVIKLSQAETLLLSADTTATMQLRFRDSGAHAFASQTWDIEIKDIVKDGEI